MKTLFLAWQDPVVRRWFPVGCLTRDGAEFRFAYVGGAAEAQALAGFVPFPEFPDLHAAYRAVTLFPLFANRVMPTHRPDYAEVVEWLHLHGSEKDPLAFLAHSNGRRQTDDDVLEVFPDVEATDDGGFATSFFLHGLRHMAPEAQVRSQHLTPGERLLLFWDAQNPVDPEAIGLRVHACPSGDTTFIGYCPRYLAPAVHGALLRDPASVRVTVRAVHPPDVPLQYRVWCEVRLAPGTLAPFESSAFRPLVGV